jgi:hypothetical protein
LTALILYLIPLVVASLTTPIYEVLQKSLALLQRLPAVVTRVLVGLLAFGLTKIAAFGIALTSTDVTLLTNQDVGALFSAGLAYLFHLSDRQKAQGPV